MYSLNDLHRVRILSDFSDYLKSKEGDFKHKILEKINIKTLQKANTEGLRLTLEELSSDLPSADFTGVYGDFRIVLRAFQDKKLMLNVTKGSKVITFEPFMESKKEEEFPNKQKIEELSNSYNFLFATLFGLLNVKENPSFEIQIGFAKDASILPSNKLQVVENNLSAILDTKKVSVTEFELETFEKDVKHKLEFSQGKEKFYSYNQFNFTPTENPPINLWELLQDSLNRMNAFVHKFK